MKKSPVKKAKQQQTEVPFKDAVSDLLRYMYLGGESFTYSPIQLNTEDQREKPYPFEDPACSQQLIHYNMDLNTQFNQAWSDQSSQRDLVNNNLNTKPQSKVGTPKKAANEGKLLGDVFNTLDASLKSKQISERIIKSHIETNAQARINNNNQLSPYNRTNAEKQKLFAERERFRQSYRK